MTKIKSKLVAVSIVALCAMPARAAVCPPYAETIVVLATTAMKAAVDMVVEQLFNTFTLQLANFAKYKVSAVKTMTAQIATSSKAQINAGVSLAQGEMAAIGSLEQTKQQLKVYQDFSALTGQGVDPCAQLTAQTAVVVASGESRGIAAESLSQVSAGPGRYGNPELFGNSLLRSRQLFFTTPDEAALGYGVATKAEVITATGERFPLAGADTNARVLFADSNDPMVAAARKSYLNYMAGVPDRPIPVETANLPAGKEYLAMKRRKDAVMSIGLSSLALVAAENTPNGEVGGMSKMTALREMVGKYYGEKARAQWQGWTSQSERGLMVDQVKMAAAHLKLDVELLEQSKRHEALLAAALAVQGGAGGAGSGMGEPARPAIR